MHQGILSKVANGTALRTETVEGQAMDPILGQSFQLTGKPLDPQAVIRLVRTSPIISIYKEETPENISFRFQTVNSIYRWTRSKEK